MFAVTTRNIKQRLCQKIKKQFHLFHKNMFLNYFLFILNLSGRPIRLFCATGESAKLTFIVSFWPAISHRLPFYGFHGLPIYVGCYVEQRFLAFLLYSSVFDGVTAPPYGINEGKAALLCRRLAEGGLASQKLSFGLAETSFWRNPSRSFSGSIPPCITPRCR
ncbi:MULTISPECIES: hypothetical protein [unclassified Eikenella]|uniref:hypothetical protein n=1 Tax=unclassified Eikenella TaxID=2639367 RepID=UPI000F6316DD|nr:MULTISPECIES: hypothetical protein [unclassified Eikenella]